MGNGMTERFNQTLLNMLGTLESHQKDDWRSYVAPLVHSYNATRHDSTGYSPYFLMFGRHPRLAVDAYLGLNSSEEPGSPSREHYATKLKKRLQFAYKVASKEAEKSAEQHKAQYDKKVRESTLDIGDRVLIRNVGLKGKNKLADKWDKDPYVVIDIPDKSVPVFRVGKESGSGTVKTLHRNMLLPFSSIPSTSQVDESLLSNKTQKPPKKMQNGRSSPEVSSESSDSDSDSDITPRYVIPQRRNKNVVRRNISGGDINRKSGNSVSFISSEPDLTASRSRSGNLSLDNSVGVSTTRSTNTVSGISDQSANSLSPIAVQPPRRSVRTRRPPDKYGEWVSNQLTAVDADSTQIWYV